MGQLAESSENQAHALGPCPQKPNCVSSVNLDRSRFIAPLQYTGSAKAARTRLLEVLDSLKGVRVVSSDDYYIHAEFVTQIFKFVDDVEFLIDEDTQTIQLKSASRVGSYDFGANRKRLNMIRDLYEKGI